MFNIYKGVICDHCGKKFKRSKGINYAGRWICSKECMGEWFKNLSTEEVLNLERIDIMM